MAHIRLSSLLLGLRALCSSSRNTTRLSEHNPWPTSVSRLYSSGSERFALLRATQRVSQNTTHGPHPSLVSTPRAQSALLFFAQHNASLRTQPMAHIRLSSLLLGLRALCSSS